MIFIHKQQLLMRLWCFFLVLILSDQIYATIKPKVFAIYSYPAGHWMNGIHSGMTSELQRLGITIDYRFSVYDYFNILQEKTDVQAKQKNIDLILTQINEFKPAYIVVVDDEAADVMIPLLKPLGIPIIFTAINNDEKEISWLKSEKSPSIQMTGVFERYPINQTVKLLNILYKKRIKKISVITSESDTSKIIIPQFEKYFKGDNNPLLLQKMLVSSSWDLWKSEVLKINKNSDALWLLVPWNVVSDQNAKEIDLKEMGTWLKKHVTIPMVSVVDVGLKMGALASVSITPDILGQEVAKIISTHLKGTPIGKIPFQYPEKSEMLINKVQCDLLNIEIPIEILEYATIVKDVELKTKR